MPNVPVSDSPARALGLEAHCRRPAAAQKTKRPPLRQPKGSLGEMTRDFVRCLDRSCGGAGDGRDEYLNLNVAADLMGVTKRRLYDVVNVMEGVGVVDRPKKSLVAWSGEDARTALTNALSDTAEEDDPEEEEDQEMRIMAERLRSLDEQERLLDEHIEMVERLNSEVFDRCRGGLYMSYREIQVAMCADMISHQGEDGGVTCIPVHMPEGCTLYESNPDKDGGEGREIESKGEGKSEGKRGHSLRFQKRVGTDYPMEFWFPSEDGCTIHVGGSSCSSTVPAPLHPPSPLAARPSAHRH